MSDVRWEGFSHEEIYSRVQQGPGPLASADAEAAWSTVESTIRDRRRPAHPRRQADRRRLAGPGRGGRAGRHDRDEQLGARRRRRRVAHQERHQRAGRAGRPVAQRHAAPAHRGVEPDRAGGGARRRARVRDGRPRRARGTDGGRPRDGGRDDEPVLQPVVGQPAPDELLDAAADGRRRGRFGEVDHEHRSARSRARRCSALGRRFAGRWFVEWRQPRPVLGPRAGCGRVPEHDRRRTVGRPQWRFRHARGDPATERRGARAVSDRRRYPDGHPGPSIRTRTHRSAGQGRFPEPPPTVAIPPRCLDQARSPSESTRAPRAGRRERSDGGRDPILPSAATSAPSYPGHPPGPGVPPTGAPACALHPPLHSTPPSRRPGRRAPPLPASANRRPAPPVPPRMPPPSGCPRDARPPRATGSCRWAVPCGPRSRRTRGRPT